MWIYACLITINTILFKTCAFKERSLLTDLIRLPNVCLSLNNLLYTKHMSDNDSCIESHLDEEYEILIPRSKSLWETTNGKHKSSLNIRPHTTVEDEVLQKLKFLGYSLIVGSWLISTISLGFVFNLWQWCFQFDSQKLHLSQKYPRISTILEMVQEQNEVVENYYVFAFFLTFVILWIWAVASWISMKLFRHSKGGGS